MFRKLCPIKVKISCHVPVWRQELADGWRRASAHYLKDTIETSMSLDLKLMVGLWLNLRPHLCALLRNDGEADIAVGESYPSDLADGT